MSKLAYYLGVKQASKPAKRRARKDEQPATPMDTSAQEAIAQELYKAWREVAWKYKTDLSEKIRSGFNQMDQSGLSPFSMQKKKLTDLAKSVAGTDLADNINVMIAHIDDVIALIEAQRKVRWNAKNELMKQIDALESKIAPSFIDVLTVLQQYSVRSLSSPLAKQTRPPATSKTNLQQAAISHLISSAQAMMKLSRSQPLVAEVVAQLLRLVLQIPLPMSSIRRSWQPMARL